MFWANKIFGVLIFVCYFMFYVQQVYQAKEVIESNVQIKQALCATIIDTDRVCLGTEDGLFCIELMKESKFTWNIEPDENSSNLVPRAHVPFGQHQDTELWSNQQARSQSPHVFCF